MTQLQRLKLGKATYRVNKDAGYFPYFTLTLRQRIKWQMAVNVAIVGEAGVGKSYLAWTLCMELDPAFSVDQIVFTYSEYMRLIRTLKMGKPIMFDEPSYAMGKRDWYKQINKVLVQTIESQRFKVHPLFIPIINMTLLDKTIRDHLIQYVVLVLRRGFAFVYRLHPSQWEEKIYHPHLCTLKMPLIGICKRESCLGCRKLKSCLEFRAQYERKKATIQDKRYEQAEAEASFMETREMTDRQLANLIYSFKDKIVNDRGQLSAKLIRVIFLHELGVKVGHNRAYTVKELLKLIHPNEFT